VDGPRSRAWTGYRLRGRTHSMKIASIAAPVLALSRRLWSRFAPLPAAVEPLKVVADLCCRARRELMVENIEA